MSVTTDTLRKLASLNLSSEQMAGVVDILADVQAAEDARKLAQRDRARKSRASRDGHVTVTREQRDGSHGGAAHVEDKTLTSEIEPQKEEQKETRARSLSPEFDQFWDAFPNKVGKPKARSAFDTAARKAPASAILAGLQRYIATKPPDRPWLNPATFLNQERWADQPAGVQPQARGSPAQIAPSMSQLLTAIRDRPNAIEPEPPEDRSGFRQAIPHLRAVGAG